MTDTTSERASVVNTRPPSLSCTSPIGSRPTGTWVTTSRESRSNTATLSLRAHATYPRRPSPSTAMPSGP